MVPASMSDLPSAIQQWSTQTTPPLRHDRYRILAPGNINRQPRQTARTGRNINPDIRREGNHRPGKTNRVGVPLTATQ
jgi:hypothetical protein